LIRTGLCVIGAGTAGFAAATAGRRLGRDVQLVALPGPLGGTCILRGCMPAKTLLASTHAEAAVLAAQEIGVEAERPRVNLPEVIRRKNALVEYFAADRRPQLEEFPLIRGHASFVAPDTIQVDGQTVRAERFLIATGSLVPEPPIAGMRESGYLTSDDVLDMTDVPARLAVIGGGPVGCEFAQYFARLGSEVTLLQDAPLLLRNEDADVALAIASALSADGVRIILGADIRGCDRTVDGRRLVYRLGDNEAILDIDAVLVTTGRVPNIAALDLDRAGIVHESGIVCDRFLRTTNPAVFAAGDVLGRRCLVHVAEYAGALAARNAFTENPTAADFDRYEAHAIFTEPEFAAAGLTERQCRDRGLRFIVRRHDFRDLGKAVVSNEPDGFIKMLVGSDRRVLGVAIVGAVATDLIGEAVALIDFGATPDQIAALPHLHPTMSEIFARVADDFGEGAG
jgi:pyruvate/2-oxoglutarate dehydrogenase complex dihydrolipoamide dehydrogenase (E3) component